MRHRRRKEVELEGLAKMERIEQNTDEILTSREARDLLKIGRTKLWELTRDCKIPAYRVGEGKTSDLRYKKSELLRWLGENRVNRPTLI